ncbi:fumarylacetoacetate hydrolase family protein [Actinoplanes sp. NBRC 103695]|uniref:fumarylacetoacetate hydrolase family protein n=1 Tax=Actinoplanes sp. NBRC 103695 TaxID=3032202 RepID=UPI0025549EB0|nr:fumarylacetoacetate hydrolase family protein [Actinoplanes sp. NBRC 103695]
MTLLVVRYQVRGQTFVGVRTDDGAIHRSDATSLASLLAGDFRSSVEQAAGGPVETGEVRLLPPVDGRTEVWAAGVTYERSSEARQEESEVADVYARVYGADRPELFFKSVAWRVAGDGDPIGIRTDSAVDVPEPELAVVVAADGTIVGYTVCDDVSSRSIEGENPLYLPQAKVYAGACALGPGIRPAWEVSDAYDLSIAAVVTRGGEAVWSAEASTKMLHRRLDDLVEYLFRQYDLPEGAILSTGTGIVPELDFTLTAGDTVAITVGEVGTLTNPVVDASSLIPTSGGPQ